MIEHKGYTFSCDRDPEHPTLHVDANTERTAIRKAREKRWDVLRVRVVAGVPKGKVARTVRRCFCPGCSHLVGVSFR